MRREQDIAIAKERAGKGEKSLYWYGYQIALEGYSKSEASDFNSNFSAKWQLDRIKPSGDRMSAREIESAIEYGQTARWTDAFYWSGYGAGLEGLNLVEAEDRHAADPRHCDKIRPWDGKKVRGVWSSLFIAFAVSFTFANILYFGFVSLCACGRGAASAFGEFYTQHPIQYMFFIAEIMFLEGMSWRSSYGAYILARLYYDKKYVVMKAMFGSRNPGSDYKGPAYIMMSRG